MPRLYVQYMGQDKKRTPALTSYSDALALAASAPGNADYYDLLCAASDLAVARSEHESAALECSAAIDRLLDAMQALTAAEAAQRLTEIRTGLGQ